MRDCCDRSKSSPLPQEHPLLNPLPQAGEEANEKCNFQSSGEGSNDVAGNTNAPLSHLWERGRGRG
ncbi:MAG: hypothetical protein EPN14_04040 [Gallionella sp.]|nr:MAG: hypothetical protein EPN14_04040 [Gallionella sp.]